MAIQRKLANIVWDDVMTYKMTELSFIKILHQDMSEQ